MPKDKRPLGGLVPQVTAFPALTYTLPRVTTVTDEILQVVKEMRRAFYRLTITALRGRPSFLLGSCGSCLFDLLRNPSQYISCVQEILYYVHNCVDTFTVW